MVCLAGEWLTATANANMFTYEVGTFNSEVVHRIIGPCNLGKRRNIFRICHSLFVEVGTQFGICNEQYRTEPLVLEPKSVYRSLCDRTLDDDIEKN
jgi:hypothetical protein